jgi:hypothetical protein
MDNKTIQNVLLGVIAAILGVFLFGGHGLNLFGGHGQTVPGGDGFDPGFAAKAEVIRSVSEQVAAGTMSPAYGDKVLHDNGITWTDISRYRNGGN